MISAIVFISGFLFGGAFGYGSRRPARSFGRPERHSSRETPRILSNTRENRQRLGSLRAVRLRVASRREIAPEQRADFLHTRRRDSLQIGSIKHQNSPTTKISFDQEVLGRKRSRSTSPPCALGVFLRCRTRAGKFSAGLAIGALTFSPLSVANTSTNDPRIAQKQEF